MNNRTYRFTRHNPTYPFGFGLSYSNFIYSELEIEKPEIKKGDSVNINFEIHNDSNISGDEVIQVYLKNINSDFRTPNSSLIYFKRMHFKADEKKKVNITINKDMMYSYDEQGKKRIEAGNFKIFVGGSSPGQISQALGKTIRETVFKVE